MRFNVYLSGISLEGIEMLPETEYLKKVKIT
jgi:hypothetical protein